MEETHSEMSLDDVSEQLEMMPRRARTPFLRGVLAKGGPLLCTICIT